MPKPDDIPRIPHRPKIYAGENGEIYVSASGQVGLGLARVFAPSVDEIRAMLLQLRQSERWSQSTMAAILGVSKHVLRRWEDKSRKPCCSSRKLIFLVHTLVFRPQDLSRGLESLITWGEGREETFVIDDSEPIAPGSNDAQPA